MRRLGLLFAAAMLFAGPAWADSDAAADALIARALELRERGKDEEALGLFRQAQMLTPSPRARAQVALAEQALGMWVPAETDLSAALANPSDPWISRNRQPLEGALAVIRKHIATLEVRGAEKADVYLDGQKVGTGAGPFRVEAGRRTLEVRAANYQTTSRSVELPGGGTSREIVALVVVPPKEAARNDAIVQAKNDPGRGQRIVGWVFVGGGAAFLATGAAALFVRKSDVDDYNRSCPGLGAQQSSSCLSQIDSSRNWLTVSIITFIAGGAAVIAGGVLVGTAPKNTPTVACGPFGCSGTF